MPVWVMKAGHHLSPMLLLYWVDNVHACGGDSPIRLNQSLCFKTDEQIIPSLWGAGVLTHFFGLYQLLGLMKEKINPA